MGSRRPAGYGYRLRFRMDVSVIPLYDARISTIHASADGKWFLFEIQTNFKLKKGVPLDSKVVVVDDDDEEEEEEQQEQVMGSERFGAVVPITDDDSRWLESMSRRLGDYWMSNDEIKWFVDEALSFAKQNMAVDGAKYAPFPVIPVVVELDVITVQREGEPIDATMDRAIRPDHMLPVSLCFAPLRDGDYPKASDDESYILHKDFLMRLPRFRRDDDWGLPRLEVCAVCSRDSSAIPAAQVSYLPCDHVFHSHCVFRWFDGGKSSCPSCGARVPADLEEECDDLPLFYALARAQGMFGSRS